MEVGTIQQVEIFHLRLTEDLFKRNKVVRYDLPETEPEKFKLTKKYYFVPLKRTGSSYKIDSKLLEKVERLHLNGYAKE